METQCRMDALLILYQSTRGSTSPLIRERHDCSHLRFIQPLSDWKCQQPARDEEKGCRQRPFLHMQVLHFIGAKIRFDSRWCGFTGMERKICCILCCSIWPGLLRGSKFNCCPRSLPAGRLSESLVAGNTPRRSWPRTGSGAAVSPHRVGSVLRLDRSADKDGEINRDSTVRLIWCRSLKIILLSFFNNVFSLDNENAFSEKKNTKA